MMLWGILRLGGSLKRTVSSSQEKRDEAQKEGQK